MPNIVLKKLTFDNMFSYGPGNELDLIKNKVTQLTAPNGSGKTSIAYILQELLYSKNVAGIKKGDILNRYSGAKHWFGTLYFNIDEHEYQLRVERRGNVSKVHLLEDGLDISEHKIPDTYKLLEELLGINAEVFCQLTYQSSVKLLEFLKATDTNRKKFLIKVFNLNKYIEIGDQVKSAFTQLDTEIQQKIGELSGIESFLDNTIIEDKMSEISIPTVDAELFEKKRELQIQLNDHIEQGKRIDKNNLYIEERNNIIFDVSLSNPGIFDDTKLGNLAKKVTEIQVEIRTIVTNLNNLDMADICYACGQTIDNSKNIELKEKLEEEKHNLKIKEKTVINSLEQEQNELKEYQIKVKEHNNNQKRIERFEQLSQLINKELPNKLTDYNEISNDLEDVSVEFNSQVDAQETARRHNESIKIRNAKVETLEVQKRNFMIRQILLKNDIISLKSRSNSLVILRKAFSTSGIVAYKLENLTKQLENSINDYLSNLSDGQFQVVFRLVGEKLNIIILNDGKESPIETASGGEYSRIQTAILFAIRKLLTKMGGSSINLLFLDEITGVLDEIGKEKLIEVLLEEDKLNVFLISHDFSHPLVDKVGIIKSDKISRIE